MRYIPNTVETEKKILQAIGAGSFDELISNIPEKFLKNFEIQLPEKLSEFEVTKLLTELAAKNKNTQDNLSFLGGGSYDHFIPSVVGTLLSRSEIYTAYTPYQPEVSQGTLQTIYEFQSMICELFSMDVSNASLYDGATAIAEAAILALGHVNKKNKILVSPFLKPEYIKVLAAYMDKHDAEIEILPEENGLTNFDALETKLENAVGLIVQSPNYLGNIEMLDEIKAKFANSKALFIMVSDPIGNALLKTPGELQADIAVAEGQALGIPQAYGGPYLGLFTANEKLIRKMPGRIIGKTVDIDGKDAFALILQTREQHIRREKATSNICTNQGLMATAATIYLSLMGKEGIKQVANICLHQAHALAEMIEQVKGFKLAYKGRPFFKEFVVQTPVPARDIVEAGKKQNIFPGIDLGKYKEAWKYHLLVAVTEKRSREDLETLVNFLSGFSK
ncbi:MAG: aminomethyl-transferring glycine dehydrogenase subunit GcvPA [Candidatus Marinimicrobia bacterium]|nr:aminomethyl-transferring glycine dehydrogenase subunit GcvPA [Candidatus Neomarinimicrobiota bacterium]